MLHILVLKLPTKCCSETPHISYVGMFKKLLAVFFMGFVAWAYKAIQPPPPKICGSPDGPPVTAPRIKLRDGRHLAYKEHGVSKDKAHYKIIFIHGFGSSRHDHVVAKALSPVLDNLFSLVLLLASWNFNFLYV